MEKICIGKIRKNTWNLTVASSNNFALKSLSFLSLSLPLPNTIEYQRNREYIRVKRKSNLRNDISVPPSGKGVSHDKSKSQTDALQAASAA